MRELNRCNTLSFVRKISIVSFLLVFFAGFGLNISAQTLLVNYDFASATAGTPCTATPLTTATGVTSTFTTGGTGGGTCTTPSGTASTVPPAFVANDLNQSVSLTSFAAGSTNFFQFQLSGVGTYQNYMLFFQSQRSGTGPVNADVQYSTNGTSFTTFQTVNPGNGSFAAFNIDLSSVLAIEIQPTVYFRILGRDGTNAAGTFRIDNFQVRASGPSAAPASINGRVTTSTGRGIAKAYLTLSGGDLKAPVVVLTNPFGYYRFQDVTTGQSYFVSVYSKRHTFENPTRVFTHGDELFGVDFTASP